MADQRTRDLERAAAGGDVEAQFRLILVKRRANEWAEPIHFDGGMDHGSEFIRRGSCGRTKVSYESPRDFLAAVAEAVDQAFQAKGQDLDWDHDAEYHEAEIVERTRHNLRCVLFVTTQTDLVTCGICKRTRAFRGLPPVQFHKIHLMSPDGTDTYSGVSYCGCQWLPNSALSLEPETVTCRRCIATMPAWQRVAILSRDIFQETDDGEAERQPGGQPRPPEQP